MLSHSISKQKSKRSYSQAEKANFLIKFRQLPAKEQVMKKFAVKEGLNPNTFGDWVREFKDTEAIDPAILADNRKKVKVEKYANVNAKIIEYIDLRRRLYQRDKCGVSYMLLKEKALDIASKVLDEELKSQFTASNGWLHYLLKRSGYLKVNLHGEGGEVNVEEAEQQMKVFRKKLGDHMEEHGIPRARIYNGDQTGLFFQKLPNTMYCKAEERSTIKGVKAMKDKNRVTTMVCTSAEGDKVPLALVGTAKRPYCFDMCNGVPPMAYTAQSNAWFDKAVTSWWFHNVFVKHYSKSFGQQKGVLILDNCPAHTGIEEQMTAPFIKVFFLPPNMTSVYQPADQGMIAKLKLGYKSLMLKKLLHILDDEETYNATLQAAKHQRKGCKGLAYGMKPHVLDCMVLLKEVWDSDKYASTESLLRCWRKSNCLPLMEQTALNEEIGRSDRLTQQFYALRKEEIDDLCSTFQSLQMKVKELSTVPPIVPDSLLEETMSTEALAEGLEYWITVEDDALVQNVEIEEAIEKASSIEEHKEDSSDEDVIMIDTDCQTEGCTAATSIREISKELSQCKRVRDKELDAAMGVCLQYFEDYNLPKLGFLAKKLSYEIFQERARRPHVQTSLQCFFDMH
jgi:DDE superfamily endonuclease/Tc5 transposase DNA-binding domain